MEDNTNTTQTAQGGNKMILIVVAVVAVLAIGSLVYASMNNKPEESSDTMTKTSESMVQEDTMVNVTPTPEEDAMMPKEEESMTPSPTDAMMEETLEVKEFVVEGSNFKFVPNAITVNKGDTVRIVFKNVGGMHDWKIDEFDAATKVIQTDEEETIEFVADKTGTFEYYCSVGAHRANGMVGNLIVK